MSREIEFNNGFVTALALFYGHREQWRDRRQIQNRDMRIYGASDHLFDIEYPVNLNGKLKRKIKKFVSDTLSVRFTDVSVEDVNVLFERCKDLLKEIDEVCFGLDVEVYYG